MAKRLFYLSLSILCLVSAYQLGAGVARGDFTESNAVGVAAVGSMMPSGVALLLDSGEILGLSSNGIEEVPAILPVSVSEILVFEASFGGGSELSDGYIVTRTGVVYRKRTAGPLWDVIGTIPGGPVPLQTES